LGNKTHFSHIRALLLAAGLGTRLKPFTDSWPKCLMPIQKKALLEIWLDNLQQLGLEGVLVNLHAHSEIVEEFLARPKYKNWAKGVYEPELLGTAGTIRQNLGYFAEQTTFFAHADNLCICDFEAFFEFHLRGRPNGTVMTMMTFSTDTPQTCGIVELDARGVVQKFHEKVANPPGNKANAAIYLIEPVVLDWLRDHEKVTDFSTEVIPAFLGKIATWHNPQVMRDIGNPEALMAAQKDLPPAAASQMDAWQEKFLKNPIHLLISRPSGNGR
jgi:mannose-1-phosphate guanylyltransferase